MLNKESKLLLEKRAKLNIRPISELSHADARKQFKEMNYIAHKDLEKIDLLSVNDQKIVINNTEINIRIFTDKDDTAQPLLVNFHGGGWFQGDLDTDDDMCRYLSKNSGFKVISVDYRLAPENKFPEGLNDCYEAVKYFHDNHEEFKINPENISLCGTSAGGNLAAAVSLKFRNIQDVNIKKQILFTPVLDYDFTTESYLKYETGYGLEKANMLFFWEQYLGTRPENFPLDRHKYFAPLRDDDYNNIPKTYIITAGCDVLKTEAEIYHKKISNKSDSTIQNFDGAIHGFNTGIGIISDAEACLKKVVEFLINK
tara:strand:- start:260 stop:1198 length:939 start_codon:yes stop_codon:yes gene_type:complete